MEGAAAPDEPRTAGERWAHEQLAALLAARFAPPAVGAFLVESFRQVERRRAHRPALARQAHGWTALGAGAWLGLAAAGREPFRRRLRDGMGWWGAVGLMLDWHLGMVETEDGRPRPLAAADAVTLLRAWLVPVALDTPSPLVCAVAVVSDGLDGRLARAAEPTRAGRDLEGLVDACFAAAALRGARRRRWLSRGAVGCELGRLALGTAYAFWAYFARLGPPDPGLVKAARLSTPVRAGGLVAAGAGHRRLGDALVAGGAGASVAMLAIEARGRLRAPAAAR